MLNQQHYDQWPGPFDNPVIDAMLHNDSHNWSECQAYVNRLVLSMASNFPVDVKEEIVQNTMLSIVRYLPNFKRDCRLTSWIVQIVRTRIADAGREQKKLNLRHTPHPNNPEEDDGNDKYIEKIRSPRTAEEECVLQEELQESIKDLVIYLSTHANSERNIHILTMHLDGLSQKDIARMLHIPAANVGYTIRTLQGFLREQKKRKLPPS